MGKRFRSPETTAAYFVTTTAVRFAKICRDEKCYGIVAEAISHALAKYPLKLLAYVIMPTHVHLVIFGQGRVISDFMRDFKRASAVRLRQEFDRSYPAFKQSFRKSNARGSGYKIWMDRYDCVAVFSEPVLKTKIKYTLQNPIRSKLVESLEDWPYSSAVNYFNPDKAILPIEVLDIDLS
jgi:REP element-mobilizing transposase RayT